MAVRRRGFTLVELLVVISIALVLSGIALPAYRAMFSSAIRSEGIEEARQYARLAQALSQARSGSSTYGIYLETNEQGPDKMVLYRGDSYAARQPESDRIKIFDSRLDMETDLPGKEVHFSAGQGRPSATGSITLRYEENETDIIDIYASGVAIERQ